ncbi:MAG: hypothetical protein IKG77_05570, partial [Prevotella sp.]|nr:hypothetical protein [Prevotella sp.]
MKHPFHLATFLFVALPMAFIIAACGKGENSSKEQASASENETEASAEAVGQAEERMKAPAIDPDAEGLISLSQCPSIYDKMEVAVSEDNTSVSITYDGQQLQAITDADDGLLATGDGAAIHFMDANFDGFVDIFIGPGESRTYSTLLLWDVAAKQFKRVGK